MLNRRRAERLPAFLGGTIVYNRQRWSTPCIVKNLSRTGARLTADHLPTLPERFELHIPQKKTAYDVRMIWRDGNVLGVEIEQARPAGDAAGVMHPAAAKLRKDGVDDPAI